VQQVEREHFMPPPRCEQCGEVVGVYVPLIHVRGDGVQGSARVLDPGLSASVSGSFYYAACCEPSSGGDAFVDA
jgi:hypothetical protein